MDTNSNELSIVEGSSNTYIMPAASITSSLARYNAFVDFTKALMVEGRDYGTVPGVSKPSLFKPGAEKLGSFFGLSPKFELTSSELDWTGKDHGGFPFFYFSYRCDLYRGENFAGSCEGSCNSMEIKYKYRDQKRKCPKCGKETIYQSKEEYGGGYYCNQKQGGCGAKFPKGDPQIENQPVGKVLNEETAEQVNTYMKMAQKRAFVGAVLLVTNASEFYTQDVEDMSIHYDLTNVITVQDKPESTQRPQPAPAQMSVSNSSLEFDPSILDEYDELEIPAATSKEPAKTNTPAQVTTANQNSYGKEDNAVLLKDFQLPKGINSNSMKLKDACAMLDSAGTRYGSKTTSQLLSLIEKIRTELDSANDGDQAAELSNKFIAANIILHIRKLQAAGITVK